MSVRVVLLVILAAGVFAAKQHVRAQPTPLEGALPDSIVVTASREAEDVRRTGRRVAVWTAQEIATQPVSSLDELLRIIGGVEVHSRGGFGVQSDITMRGSSFNGVLVLIDGARINDPMTGHFLTDLPIPLSDIARVEVVRGPATSLYGPDAIGGVIQVFTYAGLDRPSAQPVAGGTASFQLGHYDMYDLDVALRRSAGTTSVSAATAWQKTDGMPVPDESGTGIRSSEGEIRTDFTRRAHTAALVRTFNRVRLYARAGMDTRDFGAFHFYSPFPSDTAREETSTYWAQIRFDNQAESSLKWQAHVAAKQHHDEYVYNPQTPANEHTSRLLTAQIQATRDVVRTLSFTAGTSAEVRAIDSNNLGKHDDVSGGGFLLARWQLPRGLALNASGRLDYDPVYGLEATPQISAAYNFTNFTIRALAGRAVRAPNYVERYFNATLPSPRGRDLGNPDLKAESARAYEAGADLYPVPGLSFHATIFTRSTSNLIDYAKLTPEDTVFLARNIHDVRTRGLEIDANLDRSVGNNRVHLNVSYAWLDADLGRVPEGTTYKYALTNARHLLQAGISFQHAATTLGIHWLWKDRLEGTSYSVSNLRVGHRLDFGRQRLTLSGEIRNLFDTQYTEVFDAPMPGRWWLVGLKLQR